MTHYFTLLLILAKWSGSAQSSSKGDEMYVCSLKVLLGGILLTMALTAMWCVAFVSPRKRGERTNSDLSDCFDGAIFRDGKSETPEEADLLDRLDEARRKVFMIEQELAALRKIGANKEKEKGT